MAITAIQTGIASSDTIHGWSHGEVLKSETINYRTQKPEMDGLFCERIFGPVRDYECSCGKYKGIRYRGIICERCKVEVTLSKVRRERMGHIDLAVPVAHIWFYKVPPSRIGALLNLSINTIERIIYYESYVVISQGDTEYPNGTLITDTEYKEVIDAKDFVAEIGATALNTLLQQLELEEISANLKAIIKIETSADKRASLLKRLDIIEGFRLSRIKPDHVILKVLPVLPPDLRPLVPLEGGRFATSDLNDLYRRVITRNNRLKNLIAIKAPEIILRNECRLLQEAVDALFDNSRRSVSVKGKGGIALKSLADILKGKQGRFRRNLLGKRVDYSGRSVIVVDPKLKMWECGVPKTMALELFKPFIIRELEHLGYAQTVKSARKLLEEGANEVWEILERVIKNHPVLLNRAPTLHRASIQAFIPTLVEGKAIRISPLVCKPFNADFDGDQMAIHVPLSVEAQLESLLLMLSVNNVLSPANGHPLSVPTQDVIIGVYWLTKEKKTVKNKLQKVFGSLQEIEIALESEQFELDLHMPIKYQVNSKFISTTPGRVVFNKIIPEEIGFINNVVDNKKLTNLVGEIYRCSGKEMAVKFLDEAKELGYEYATKSGLTIGITDMVVPEDKQEILDYAFKKVKRVHNQHKAGVITESERYNTVVDIWMHATNQIEKQAIRVLEESQDGFNPLHMMEKSGSRGNKDQVRQITGIRGLMTRPRGGVGEIIETPINSSFKEGLSVLEYFISTHGARKGLTDTALKTAQAGYLTRKLIDVAQDIIITEEDCGTIMGISISAIREGGQIIEPIAKRIQGRFALEDIINPITSQVIIFGGQEITNEKAEEIEVCGIEKIYIRSVLTCEAKKGICQKCYGRDLSKGKLVELGVSAGVIAAQSIGEPGTQLTLRTFHIGGIATRIIKESQIKAPSDGIVSFEKLKICVRRDKTQLAIFKGGKIHFKKESGEEITYKIPYGAAVKVKDGDAVEKDYVLFEWDPYSFPILSEVAGELKYSNLIENVTYRLEYDERTGRKQPVVVTHRKIHPELCVYDKKKEVASYLLPTKAHIFVQDGAELLPGDLLAKIPREMSKTRDITGGLPRVTELFEARHPKDKAIITEVDGIVEFRPQERGYRIIAVQGTHETRKYRIPFGKHLLIYNGEEVFAGDKLVEGPVDPHDILSIKGVQATQEFLVKQIQEVYILQGVEIADKHIGIIVRQMLSRVRIKDPGDTMFVEGQVVEKIKLIEENKKIIAVGANGATFEPVLLGVTRAILTTDSFISAASFQETTKVLTNAAIHKKRDLLLGIKENVIIGNLIPTGTGIKRAKPEYALVSESPVTEEVEEENADDKSIDTKEKKKDTEKA